MEQIQRRRKLRHGKLTVYLSLQPSTSQGTWPASFWPASFMLTAWTGKGVGVHVGDNCIYYVPGINTSIETIGMTILKKQQGKNWKG